MSELINIMNWAQFGVINMRLRLDLAVNQKLIIDFFFVLELTVAFINASETCYGKPPRTSGSLYSVVSYMQIRSVVIFSDLLCANQPPNLY